MGGPLNVSSFESNLMVRSRKDIKVIPMVVEEEAPSFREVQTTNTKKISPQIKHNFFLSRGDSSSTANSTITASPSTASLSVSQSPIKKVDLEEDRSKSDRSTPPPTASSNSIGSSFNLDQWLSEVEHRIYSRQEEEGILLKKYRSYQHSAPLSRNETFSPELCLISGPRGVGKTRLARTLQPHVEADGGYFLQSKFDEIKHPKKPTGLLADAIAELTASVLAKGDDFVTRTKQAILKAVGDELGMLVGAIPSLEKIVGEQRGEPVQMNCQLADRFIFALHDLFAAISGPECPIVLLVDDLQWGPPCGLNFLRKMISSNTNRYLFIMGTCSDENISPNSAVSTMLRNLEDKNHCQIFNITISQKPRVVLQQAVKKVLPMPEERVDALANLVCHQTRGNPLYLIEFLRWLYQEQFLQYNEREGIWSFQDDEIELAIDPCRLGDFFVEKLEQLPKASQTAIATAACLGKDINEKLMDLVLPVDNMNDILEEAAAKGVLVFDEKVGYSFRHEGLQNACLSLIPDEEKQRFHVMLGLKLLRGLSEREQSQYKFLILSLLKAGKYFIRDEQEKEMVALLCLDAGKASARASSFGAAADYLNLGIDILEESWSQSYRLKLALYNAAAEMEMTLTNYEQACTLIQDIFDNAKTFKEKLQGYTTLIYIYGITDQQHLAVDTAMHVLTKLGETFPRRACKTSLAFEFYKVKRLVNRKSSNQIMRMEPMKNEEKLAAMQILNISFLNALLVRPALAPFIQLKAVEITMKHGLSALSSVAFACYGMLLGTIGKFDDAFRFGSLSLELLERFGTKEYLPRVYAGVYGSIYAWRRPIRETIEPLKHASFVGSQTGDIEFSCLNANLLSSALFFSDASLPQVASEVGSVIDMMVARRQDSLLVLTKPFYQLTLNLMGETDNPLELDEAFMTHAESTRNATSLLCLRMQNMILRFLFGDFVAANAKLDEIECTMGVTGPPGLEGIFCLFFSGMTKLVLARKASTFRRRNFLKKTRWAIRQLKKLSRCSPDNCIAMKFLLQAEYASVCGDSLKAYEKFTTASGVARGSGIRMIEAVAHERTAHHLIYQGDEVLATSSFKKALSCYSEWGAKAKVDHLEKEMNDILCSKSTVGLQKRHSR